MPDVIICVSPLVMVKYTPCIIKNAEISLGVFYVSLDQIYYSATLFNSINPSAVSSPTNLIR